EFGDEVVTPHHNHREVVGKEGASSQETAARWSIMRGTPMSSQDLFRTETAGLPGSQPTAVVSLSDGDVFDLHVSPVVKQLGDSAVRMLAYNGSIPGPALRVRQGSEIVVNVVN